MQYSRQSFQESKFRFRRASLVDIIRDILLTNKTANVDLLILKFRYFGQSEWAKFPTLIHDKCGQRENSDWAHSSRNAANRTNIEKAENKWRQKAQENIKYHILKNVRDSFIQSCGKGNWRKNKRRMKNKRKNAKLVQAKTVSSKTWIQ